MIVAVYFTKPNEEDPPFDKEDYRTSYREFGAIVEAKGAELFIVRGMKTYLGGNSFMGGWKYKYGTFVRHEERIDADIIFDKGEDFAGDAFCNVLVDRGLLDACIKDHTYALFPQWSPLSFLAHSPLELSAALSHIPTDLVVIKPPNCGAGKGVHILSKQEVLSMQCAFPVVLQEFLDTTAGIPGIIEGPHDFRIILIEGEVILSYVRTPPPGKLIANVAQGGTFRVVDPENIPKEALAIALGIDREFSKYPRRFFSVDMGRTKDGTWKIIECNAPSGLFSSEGDPRVKNYQERQADLLLEAAQDTRGGINIKTIERFDISPKFTSEQ